jgi:hypothetical protein
MAETHGQSPKNPNEAKRADTSHGHDDEELVRTPAWLPFLGIGLLAVGALASYLWILPGSASTQAVTDGEAGDAASESSILPPTPPAPQPLPGGAQPQIVPIQGGH